MNKPTEAQIRKYILAVKHMPLVEGQLESMVILHFDIPDERAKKLVAKVLGIVGGSEMTEQNKGLLTPEEVEQGISDYYWCDEMPMDTGITRENYAVALAQLAKLTKQGWMSPDECQECQAQTEVKIELAVKQERERIGQLIDTKKDLIHEGYHGYAGKTPNSRCKGCQIEQALKGEPTIKPLQVLVNGEWREASEELKATADSIEQSLKLGKLPEK